MDKEIIKGIKFRIYPNKKQQEFLNKILNIYRFYYNQCVELLLDCEENDLISIKQKLKIKLKELKVSTTLLDNNLLKLIQYEAIFQSCKNYKKLKAENKTLKFKSKLNKSSISLFAHQINFKLDYQNKSVDIFDLIKIKAKGIRENLSPQNRVYISKTLDDKYYISYNSKTFYTILSPPKEKKRIGIDLGLNTLITTSDGKTILNERILGRMQNRITSLQRKLSRQVKGSRNYVKTKIALQRAFNKVTNIRNDYLNKISYRIIKDNSFIGIEDLDIKALEQKRLISKSLMDACFGILVKDLEYKALWNNRTIVKVNRYFPSSQLCSHCGSINKKVKDLSVREWTCDNCHTHHNRDINAAKNILKEAYRLSLVNIGINNVRIKIILDKLFKY